MKCFFKGRSTREMLTQILFGAYCVIGGMWILKTLGDFRKWKNDTRILKYLQVSFKIILVAILTVAPFLVKPEGVFSGFFAP